MADDKRLGNLKKMNKILHEMQDSAQELINLDSEYGTYNTEELKADIDNMIYWLEQEIQNFDYYYASTKKSKMKKFNASDWSGAITGMEFVSGEIKLEAHDLNNNIGNVTIDMGEIPYTIVNNFIREIAENYDEIPSLYRFAENHYNKFNASAKKSRMCKSDEIEGIINDPDDKFRYQMLSRLQSDMEYYFGNGRRYEGNLWTKNFDSQIDFMKRLWNTFTDKPEWLTMEEIEDFARYKNMPGWYYHHRYSDGTGGYWAEGNDDDWWVKSTKKSINEMSFEANVNSLRKSNYAKTGNLNSVMKKRD